MFKKDNLVKYISIVVIGIVFLGVFVIYNSSSRSVYVSEMPLNEFTHETNNISEGDELEMDYASYNNIFVEIKGEVLNPSVYEIKEGSIVRDLIAMAGGLTDKGDVSNINQARRLVDGECIVVYSSEELKDMETSNVSGLIVDNSELSVNPFSSVININTASKEELKQLNGIGDTLAESIISYRESNGGFKTIEEIKNVPRIGEKTFEKFKDKIRV